MRAVTVLIGVAALALLASTAHSDLVWFDGSREPGYTPPGRLISDNLGYYGDCVLTGVQYRYESAPDAPSDKRPDQSSAPSRRLLDGRIGVHGGDNGGGVGRQGPLVVTFDFTRTCTFNEIDVCSVSRKVALKLECASDSTENWRTAFEQQLADSPDSILHRIQLPETPTARCLRLTIEGEGITHLDEVLAWGDAEVTPGNPEAIAPLMRTLPVLDYCAFSIPGVDKTGIVFGEFRVWQREIGGLAKLPAVWSQVSTWGSISHQPVRPPKNKLNRSVHLTMARNETECATLALTNTGYPDPVELEVRLSGFHRVSDGTPAPKVKGKLRAMATIPSSIFGVVLGPLLEPNNMPGLSVLKHYTTNADSIYGFPRVKLPRMSSAVLWLSVTTEGAEPGTYEATLSCPNGPGIKVRIQVLDVTLPNAFAWIICYSHRTDMFPFIYDDRLKREADYRESLHLDVWHGFPDTGSLAEVARRKVGGGSYLVWGVPHKIEALRKTGRNVELSESDRQDIRAYALGLTKKANALGLDYDQWSVEFWDEPGRTNIDLYGAIAAEVKQADPKIRIYCNPTTTDLPEWYNRLIDVSVPHYKGGLEDPKAQRFFSAPRLVDAYYRVCTNSAKGERAPSVELYRELAWNSIVRGWNGWGFYAYYGPRGDPWDDFDWVEANGQTSPDFVMVYPGPRGPIPTRQSEAVREGYEDYCLITLLRQHGKKAEVDAIVRDFKRGVPMTELRLRALKAAARR